jgi:GNAT superfamily N-acetyltransferase
MAVVAVVGIFLNGIGIKTEEEKPMDYEFISNYRDNTALQSSFNRLAGRVFGLSFDEYYSRGLWDDSYVCHSYLYGGEVVANVSATTMNLTVDGSPCKAAQLGTVMTAPEHRGRGLAAALIRRVIAEYEKSCGFIYLFANDSVLGFYPKFGFLQHDEQIFSCECVCTGRGGDLRRLDLADEQDYRLLCGLSQRRRPVSQALGVSNHGILIFNCLYGFSGQIFYSKAFDAVIIFEQCKKTLNIYDIICKNDVPLRELCGVLPACDEIRLFFTPDDNTRFTAQPKTGADTILFIRPGDALGTKGLIFPETSHT